MTYSPAGVPAKAKADLAEVAGRLEHARNTSDLVQRSLGIERLRRQEAQRLAAKRSAHKDRTLTAFHILCDLAKQGWAIRVRGGAIEMARPSNPLDPEQDRLRIRQQ